MTIQQMKSQTLSCYKLSPAISEEEVFRHYDRIDHLVAIDSSNPSEGLDLQQHQDSGDVDLVVIRFDHTVAKVIFFNLTFRVSQP